MTTDELDRSLRQLRLGGMADALSHPADIPASRCPAEPRAARFHQLARARRAATTPRPADRATR